MPKCPMTYRQTSTIKKMFYPAINANGYHKKKACNNTTNRSSDSTTWIWMICHSTDLHDEYNVTNWWHHTAKFRPRQSPRSIKLKMPLSSKWPQWIIQPRRIGLNNNITEIRLHIVDRFRMKHEVYRTLFDRCVIYSHHRSNLCTIMCT